MIKLYLVTLPPFGWNSGELFTIGKIYEGYDPQTLQPAHPSYIVKCNDGNFRKVQAEYFVTLDEWRDGQLNKIL